MVSIIKARQLVLGVSNGTDTVFFDPTELNYFSEPISSTGLIRRQGSIVFDPTIAPLSEPLDPDTNPQGRWNEGNIVALNVGTENFGPPQVHPVINRAVIREKPFWAEGADIESLSVEIGDELSYLDYPVPVDDRSGVDIASTGITLTEVINNHLIAGCTTPLVNVGPTAITRRTWQAIDRQSVIETAGEIAFGSEGGPWFIYRDDNGDNRIFNYDDAVATPRFTLNEADLLERPKRQPSQIKRYGRLIVRSNLVSVDDCFFGTRVLEESFREVADYKGTLYGGVDRNHPVLELRVTETRTLSNSGKRLTTITVEEKTDRRNVFARDWTVYVSKHTTLVEDYNDDGFLIRSRTTIQEALTLARTRDLRPTEGRTVTYFYSHLQHIRLIRTEYTLPVYQQGSVFLRYRRDQIADSVIPVLLPVGIDLESYSRDGCRWLRTISKTAVENSDTGQRILLRYESPKKEGTTFVDAPPAPQTQPQPELIEEPIETEASLFPSSGPRNKVRDTDVTLRFVSSEAALQSCANWLARQMWQQSSTYTISIPYFDAVRAALASPNPPVFSFDLVRNEGSKMRLLWNAEEYIFDQTETRIEVEAQLIGLVEGDTLKPIYKANVGVRMGARSGSAIAEAELTVESASAITTQEGDGLVAQDGDPLENNS